MQCNLCNESFFITNDTYSQVIAEESDMYRLESPCLSCNKDIREECKKQLINILSKQPVKDIDVTALFNKYNTNGSDSQNRINKNWVRKSKKNR